LRSNATLQEVLQVDSRVTQHLNTHALEQLFDPSQYLGEAIAFTDRVLAAHRQRKV
jgi:adenylosuccinate lyase